jgi:hypothetical protein
VSRFEPLAGLPDWLRSPPIRDAISGRATIQRVTDTGLTVEDNPALEFDLTVALPGREPYRVTHRLVVSRQVLHNFRAGRAVPVTVDRRDPHRLAIG